jgi:hypothetical protein
VRVGGAIAVALGVLAASTHLLGLEEFDDLRRRAFGQG